VIAEFQKQWEEQYKIITYCITTPIPPHWFEIWHAKSPWDFSKSQLANTKVSRTIAGRNGLRVRYQPFCLFSLMTHFIS
jgi:hypothetical protein